VISYDLKTVICRTLYRETWDYLPLRADNAERGLDVCTETLSFSWKAYPSR